MASDSGCESQQNEEEVIKTNKCIWNLLYQCVIQKRDEVFKQYGSEFQTTNMANENQFDDSRSLFGKITTRITMLEVSEARLMSKFVTADGEASRKIDCRMRGLNLERREWEN